MIWAVFHKSSDFSSLVHKLFLSLRPIVKSLTEERREVIPHVTLARMKGLVRRDVEILPQSDIKNPFIPCREIELVESELLPGGSRYTRIAAFSFQNARSV